MQRFAASAQTGMALAGLVLGALFFRSLGTLDEASLGFEPEGMVVTDFRTGALSSELLDLSAEGYPTLEEGAGALLERLQEALTSLPGVGAAAFADGVPLDRRRSWTTVSRADLPDEEGGRITAEYTRVGEGFLEAIGASLARGRGIDARDDATSDPVVVITESLANRLWPGEDPLGRSLVRSVGRDESRVATVVGVARDVAPSRVDERWPQVFVPIRQDFRARAMIILRVEGELSTLAGPIRSAIRSVDPALPQPRLLPARSIVERSTQEQRGAARMGGGLGLMVLLLSALGVYGVVAMAVAGRTREIGLRMALGASRVEVLGGVLRDALRLAAPGLAVGALLAAAAGAAMRSTLLGVSPTDPASYLSAVGLLLVVVVLASFVPARRASGVDPMEALRTE